jgi:hypothetical protein
MIELDNKVQMLKGHNFVIYKHKISKTLLLKIGYQKASTHRESIIISNPNSISVSRLKTIGDGFKIKIQVQGNEVEAMYSENEKTNFENDFEKLNEFFVERFISKEVKRQALGEQDDD